uniref:Uncharacterized protein n=1 Tax=Glossina austeni TaxID=7395 RepID=A0A1A9UIY4_GLOAU
MYRQFVKSKLFPFGLSINFILMFMYEDDDDDDDDDDDVDVEAFTVLLLTMCCCLYYYAVVDAHSAAMEIQGLYWVVGEVTKATLSGNMVLFREHDCNRKTLKLSLMPNKVYKSMFCMSSVLFRLRFQERYNASKTLRDYDLKIFTENIPKQGIVIGISKETEFCFKTVQNVSTNNSDSDFSVKEI